MLSRGVRQRHIPVYKRAEAAGIVNKNVLSRNVLDNTKCSFPSSASGKKFGRQRWSRATSALVSSAVWTSSSSAPGLFSIASQSFDTRRRRDSSYARLEWNGLRGTSYVDRPFQKNAIETIFPTIKFWEPPSVSRLFSSNRFPIWGNWRRENIWAMKSASRCCCKVNQVWRGVLRAMIVWSLVSLKPALGWSVHHSTLGLYKVIVCSSWSPPSNWLLCWP